MAGIALLGAGLFAKEAHLPALARHKADLRAIYSRTKGSAASLLSVAAELGFSASGIDVYADEGASENQNLAALLQRIDISAVIVALPILVQPDIVRRCLASGKHVLCEKPIAKDVETAAQLASDYEKLYLPRGLVLSVAEQFRYDLAFTHARRLVSERIGNVRHVHARVWGNIQPGSNKWYDTEWRKSPQYQGGFILDGGVHFVALIRYVSGLEVVQTASLSQQIYPHLPPLDTVNAGLQFSNGAAGSISFTFASVKGSFEFIFVGDRGAVTVAGAGDSGQRITLEDREGKALEESVIDGQAVSEEIRAFLQASHSGVADPKSRPREALADLAVIESICSGGGEVARLI